MKFLFYRPLKVTANERDICFWSDTHFGHRCERWETPIWKARGFSSIEEHDWSLINYWNEKATPNTTFFHLGDFIFGYDTVQRFDTILKQVNFETLYLMPGNHNSGWKQHFEQQSKNILYLSDTKRVIFVPNYLEALINNQPIVMSHYPIVSYNGQAKGSWMLHGHCHSNLYKNPIGSLLYKAKIVDVGIENMPKPTTFSELLCFFENKGAITFDHHNQSTLNPF